MEDDVAFWIESNAICRRIFFDIDLIAFNELGAVG